MNYFGGSRRASCPPTGSRVFCGPLTCPLGLVVYNPVAMAEPGEPLTEREREIIRLVATGATNRMIAHQLSVSPNTVKVHLRNAFTKLKISSLTEATVIAIREGWLDVPAGPPDEAVRPGEPADRGDEQNDATIYDVFISHATEDKDEVVRPLANALVGEGLRVWYDEFELRIGDSLRRKIDSGLARSRFGVVVLSHSFFAKNWPQYELDGLETLEMTGKQVILPLWHRITKSEVMAQSASLADKVARNTADYSIEEIAHEIAHVIRNPG